MRSSINTMFLVALVFGVSATLVPRAALPAEGKSKVLMDEMTVSVRKREESLQDAPVAVSVYSGEQLDFRGVTNIGQIDQFTPNLVLNKSPTNSNVINAAAYIRGIGQNDFVPVIDPGVGIYVDGVYLGRSVGGILDIVDIERVEVLRGPQGTLFGRNTIGGAVDIKTRKPDEELGGNVSVRTGTDSMVHVRGAVNVPITDTFYTRFSAALFQQDGYVDTVFLGEDLGNDDSFVLRAAGRWLPTSNLEFNLTVDYSKDDENGNPFVITGIQPLNLDLASNPNGAPSMTVAQNTIVAQLENGGIMPDGEFFNPVNPPTGFPFNFMACFEPQNLNNASCYNTRFIDDGSKDKNFSTDPHSQELEVWGTNLNVDWQLGENLTLKSITSFRTFDGDFEGDEDGAPQRVSYLIDTYDHDQISQELQLLGTSFDDKLEWIVGAYYYNEEGENINPVRFSQVSIQSGGEYEATSWAVFGQGTWSFTDALDLTVGLRYTDDSRDYRPDQFFEELPIGPLPVFCEGGQICEVGDRVVPFEWVSTSNDETLPYVNLSYQFNDGLMGYATYSEGYKSGGFTQRIFPPEENLPSFDPEYVDSYELGLKYDGWSDRLRVNFAVFFNDYTDLQLSVATPDRVGPFVTNAGDAEIWGFELEGWLTPAEGWFLMATVGYTDPEYTDLGAGVQGLTLDSRFEHISDWNASAQLYKEFSLASWGFLTPRIEWSYRSEYGTNSNNIPRDGAPTVVGGPFDGVNLGFGIPNPALVEDDLHLLNAGIRWDVKDSGFALIGGIDNLTDEQYRQFGNYQDAFGFTQETFDRGRQWYVQLDYAF